MTTSATKGELLELASNEMETLELELDLIPTHDTPSAPAAAQTYGPPSPLITFAPDSPSLSPTLSVSSLEDLTSTIQARPASPQEQSPLPTVSRLTTPNETKIPHFHGLTRIDETKPTSFSTLKRDRTSSRRPSLMLGPLIDADLQARNVKNFRNTIEADDGNNEEHDMPRGYPYRDWRGFGYLALEWLAAMSGLLFGFMESECRLNGARHTI
ncbi:MAG: hypothetical protein LQ352_003368 [Teloschistes flavicans]|nr:MAG: hypothetical protein LQ352_003368 [Teloschistes flavicans]